MIDEFELNKIYICKGTGYLFIFKVVKKDGERTSIKIIYDNDDCKDSNWTGFELIAEDFIAIPFKKNSIKLKVA